MNTANNQLRQDTDRRLREALLSCMEQERTPTVGELCAMAVINRSTFYRHYLDVYDLMEKTERHIQTEMVRAMQAGGLDPFSQEVKAEALIPMIRFMGQYRHFYMTYLKTHLDVSMEAGIQAVWDKYLKPAFIARGVTSEAHMLYYFQYFKAGVLSLLKRWLDQGCPEPPAGIAELIAQLINR